MMARLKYAIIWSTVMGHLMTILQGMVIGYIEKRKEKPIEKMKRQ